MHLLAIGLAAMFAPQTPANAHPPAIEQQLAFIEGDWTIAGMETIYRDHCTWFDAKSFIICDTDDRRPGGHHAVAILGWSAADNHFTYQEYDASGRSRTEPCYASSEKGLTCLGEFHTKDGMVQTRSIIWPTATGLGLRQEKSVNAGPWTDVGQVAYVHRKP